MKIDIVLAGVGGQGILSIATVIGNAAVSRGLYLKQAEVHGMSQRGGDVQSHLRLSSGVIASDLIPYRKADMIISIEPMEALRYLPMLSPEGWLVTNTTPFVNIPDYPSQEALLETIEGLPRKVAIDADQTARQAGSPRSANMVILGAASPFLRIDFADLEQAIEAVFSRKGDDIVQRNLECLRLGKAFADRRNSVVV
jgi:indolepyruvate ferredoxin oxidoreductase beta subunit